MVFRHGLLHAPDVVAGQVDVLPAKRREMGQQMVRRVFDLAENGDGAFQVSRVPKNDGRDEEVEARGAMLLVLISAVADFAGGCSAYFSHGALASAYQAVDDHVYGAALEAFFGDSGRTRALARGLSVGRGAAAGGLRHDLLLRRLRRHRGLGQASSGFPAPLCAFRPRRALRALAAHSSQPDRSHPLQALP